MRHYRNLAIVSAALASAAFCVSTAQATEIAFQTGASNAYVNNYAGTSDTSFDGAYDAGGGYSGGNYGGADFMYANQTVTWEERRALIRFDLSALTGKNLTVNSVTMKLAEITNASPDNVTVYFYPITAANAAWQQGTSTDITHPANPGEATWDHLAAPSTNWAGSAGLSTPGTDYVNTAAATGTYKPTDATGTIVSFTLPTSLVQSWIDNPSDNAGLLLLTNNDSTNGYYRFAEYGTSENATPEMRPQLVLDVSGVPEPASLFLLAAAPLMLLRRRRSPEA
jgi:hypothetical protein